MYLPVQVTLVAVPTVAVPSDAMVKRVIVQTDADSLDPLAAFPK